MDKPLDSNSTRRKIQLYKRESSSNKFRLIKKKHAYFYLHRPPIASS